MMFGHHMLQTQKSPHEGGYEDATKFFFFYSVFVQ